MKAVGNIYCKICEKDNVRLAIIKASKNKGHRKDVRKAINDVEKYTDILQKMLVEKTYEPNSYIKKTIYDGANKKERIIYKPVFFPILWKAFHKFGNFTSQWFANFNLQDLDHFIKEQLKVKYYVRYMDDMVLFGRNKKELHKLRLEVSKFLNKEGLQLKENWQLFKTDSRPLDFMGFRFYRGYTTLRRGIFLRMKRRIKKIYKKEKISKTDAGAVMSYYGWIKHSNSYKLNEKYVKPYVNMAECKEVLKNENRKQSKTKKI